MRYSVLIAGLALSNLGIGEVAAQPLPAEPLPAETQPTVAFRYDKHASADSCPSLQDLERGVVARLGRQAFRADSERSLVVRVSAVKRGFAAEIVVYDANGALVGTRSLATEQPDCKELLSAMELAITIAIDPLYIMPTPPQSPALAEPADVTTATPIAAPAPVGSPPPPPPPMVLSEARTWLGAGILVAKSGEPSSSLGFTLSYKHRAAMAWALEARADLPSRLSVGVGQVETALLSAAGLGCLLRGSLDLCGMLGLGMLRSAGLDYAESYSALTPYAAAGGRISYRVEVKDDFALEFSGDLLVRLNQTTLLVDQDVAWESSPLEIGLGLRGAWGLD